MSTVVMGNVDRFINCFSKKGRAKNDLYKQLTEKGMNEVRVRDTGKDSFVMLASKKVGVGSSDMTLGVNINKGMVQKETGHTTTLSIIDVTQHSIAKYFMDLNGKMQKSVTKIKRYVYGKLNDTKTITEVPSKYKKVIDKSASTETVKVDYNNGNFYHLEKDNVLGYKKYHKYFDGSEYINVVEKK